MKEVTKVIIITLVIAFLGLVSAYWDQTSQEEFTFYKSEIIAEGNNITETLYFKPDKNYHTLFRNFQSQIRLEESQNKNTIQILDVKCSSGFPYARSIGICKNFVPNNLVNKNNCLSFTENNEYGCGFGDALGFKEDGTYSITARYKINPENLFLIEGKHYIKFVAYSKERHGNLKKNNFIVRGAVTNEEYNRKENVIIYIPSNGNYNVVEQRDFEFDNEPDWNFLWYLFTLLPAILFFGFWFKFGKDSKVDLNPEISFYPKERAAWKVAAYFNPPFTEINKDFFSAMMLELYHKKAISIEVKKIKKVLRRDKKETWIKLNSKENLDEMQKDFFSILETIKGMAPKKYINGDYFNLTKSIKDFTIKLWLKKEIKRYERSVKNESKKFQENNFKFLVLVYLLLGLFSFIIVEKTIFPIFLISIIMIVLIINDKTAILLRFKEDYYKEYKHWQAFKKYLSHSFTIKDATHKTVVVWEKYLLYATAMGVSKKVLKEMKKLKIINQKQYIFYTGINLSMGTFTSASGKRSSGFGGAAAGGVGGGGSGGR